MYKKNKSILVASVLVISSLSSFTIAEKKDIAEEKHIETTAQNFLLEPFNIGKEHNISNRSYNVTKKKNILNYENEEKKDSSALRGLGWIVMGLGLLTLLFLSIIGGVIVMGLGLILIIAGKPSRNNSSSSNNKNVNELQDVVYLKTGGVLRGIIIEQVPNVSLKIQTEDGNIFIYKMDEIIKTTKEPKFNN